MNQNEREEFIFDLANHQIKTMSKAGVHALAVDRISSMLESKTDKELIEMAPANLVVKDKKRHNKNKPKGF